MKFVLAILLGGLAAGALDIVYAILAYGARGLPPMTILQSVASGVLGREAYTGGAEAATLGLGLHFLIATLMAAGYVILTQVFPALLRFPVASGLVYGLFLFAVMNFAVVPLSAAYPGKFPEGWYLAGALFTHTVLVGLPIALIARQFLAPR
jgi:uncharacterized membrane protein YagU involved in acid resistance